MTVWNTLLPGTMNRRKILNLLNPLTTTHRLPKRAFDGKHFSTSGRRLQTKKQEDSELWVNSKITDMKPCVGITMPELIRENLSGWENSIAFESAETGIKYTHSQVLDQSRRFAAALLKSDVGFKRGDVVAVLATNIPEYCAILFGIWDAGLVATPLSPAYTTSEIKRQLELSGSKAIITLPAFLPSLRVAKSELPILKSIIVVGETYDGCHSFYEMAKTDPTGVSFTKGSEIDTLSEVALLPFSSGTTGLPKGVMLTHSNLTSNLIQHNHPAGNSIEPFSPGNPSRLVGVLPFFHSFGLTCVTFTTMWKGAHTVTLPHFKPELFIQTLRHHKPTDIHVVTPIISFMVNSRGVTREELDSTRCIVSGAAPVGAALINQLLAKAEKFVIFQEGYGMAEMSPVSHYLPPSIKNTKIGSCGIPIPLTMTKVVDTVTGETLSRFEHGELCVKGPQVMKGYLNNEEATRNTIDSDGWLHTGDIVYYDNDDCLYIVDRLKELIKVRGIQVSPAELENLLRSHDNVADVAVVGVPDKKFGELPRAYIVRKKDAQLNEGDINDFVKGKLASYKHLRGGIEFVEGIPKAASGKILRRVLLEEFNTKKQAVHA